MYLKNVIKAFEGHTKVRLIWHYESGTQIEQTDVESVMNNGLLTYVVINPNYYLHIERDTIIIHI